MASKNRIVVVKQNWIVKLKSFDTLFWQNFETNHHYTDEVYQ